MVGLLKAVDQYSKYVIGRNRPSRPVMCLSFRSVIMRTQGLVCLFNNMINLSYFVMK